MPPARRCWLLVGVLQVGVGLLLRRMETEAQDRAAARETGAQAGCGRRGIALAWDCSSWLRLRARSVRAFRASRCLSSATSRRFC
jgi:hypothetical protein